jgi:hypothetical protein
MKEFTISYASMHMIKIGLVVIKRKSMFGKRANGVQEV